MFGFLVLLVVLATFVTATGWLALNRQAAGMAAYPPEGQFVQVGGHDVHYVQRGTGPDLVLIHGASGNTRDFTFSLVDRLTDRYRVTVFDRPGLGYTPRLAPRDVTLAQQADLLVGAARALGVENPVVLGQSFGGAVAMTWAVEHPDYVAAVVDVSGATYPWPGELNRLYATMARPVIGPALAWMIGAWVSDRYIERSIEGVFAPQNAPSGYADDIGAPLVIRPHSLMANAQQRTDLREELRALSPRYPALTLPIEIVHGTADDTVSLQIHSEALARDVASAHLTPLPGIGHMPHHVAQDEVIAAIDRAAQRAGLR
ncbi:hydrolase or acyltransferase (alpha/beta hydrolase) [Primorskyibacter flagellatus]|uniref:Hydrolase or acyltransferase (Alpha/beta hydrolase) n=1 Tax=Primorskyibacter flagellatus TaxID=1387277 RepID=A0A917A4J0_9RHOB|nr:alpha/beta hydrolase [Primorskyibacter flagellatus]GGE26865.1 hydrolase or acyltransferase (alpha/beta hydrolase) [Primorskyibacter flagellatus]